MARPETESHHSPTQDDLDDILNGVIDGEDVFDTSYTGQPRKEPESQKQAETANAGLGIDEEIKIVKKRQPIPKLDEQRLLSAAGVPKLQRISKERLKFKGKGHEYGDIARMLNMYQLWLDDLYPRAKFADGLAIIEKLGHSKRMQTMRKEWIDQGKPRQTVEDSDEDLPQEPNTGDGDQMGHILQTTTSAEGASQPMEGAEPQHPTNDGNGTAEADEPNEDELDALLAEEMPDFGKRIPHIPAETLKTSSIQDEFADDMEAMAEMDDMW